MTRTETTFPLQVRPPPDTSDLEHLSIGLLHVLADPRVGEDAKRAIRLGIDMHGAHAECPCIECHRRFGTAP